MVSAYDIKSQTKTQSEKIVVTLPQTVQIMPFLGIQLFKNFAYILTVIVFSLMQAISTGYPKILMTPGFSSLIFGSHIILMMFSNEFICYFRFTF